MGSIKGQGHRHWDSTEDTGMRQHWQGDVTGCWGGPHPGIPQALYPCCQPLALSRWDAGGRFGVVHGGLVVAQWEVTGPQCRGTPGLWHYPWVPCSAGPPYSTALFSPTPPQPALTVSELRIRSTTRLEKQANTSLQNSRMQPHCLHINVIRAVVMIFNNVQNNCCYHKYNCRKKSSPAFPCLWHLLIQLSTYNPAP